MKILLLSNLYPSKKHPYYGTFVKKSEHGLKSVSPIFFDKIVITKHVNSFRKLFAYICFFASAVVILNFFRKKYDIIYVHYLKHTLIPFFFVFNKRNLPPLILNAHGGDIFPDYNGGLVKSLVEKIIPYASKIVVPSKYFQEEISLRFNRPKEDIFISPSGGIDLKNFRPKPRNLNKKGLTIGFLGRIEEKKGIDLLLNSLPEMKKRIPNLKCKIAGGGTRLKDLYEFVSKHDLEHTVEILGPIAHDQVPEYFSEVDLFLFLSRRKGESLGLVAIEALASGTPVIAYRNGAVEEFIQDGKNGYILDRYNEQSLKELVYHYYQLNTSEKNALSRSAFESALRFDEQLVAKDMVAMLNDSLK